MDSKRLVHTTKRNRYRKPVFTSGEKEGGDKLWQEGDLCCGLFVMDMKREQGGVLESRLYCRLAEAKGS